jgi:hypothetical protein
MPRGALVIVLMTFAAARSRIELSVLSFASQASDAAEPGDVDTAARRRRYAAKATMAERGLTKRDTEANPPTTIAFSMPASITVAR